ncbi:thioesterase family protein [Sutcliffiella rhizosphaerae]|nr:thioesterase [Sutcliffiella rhizosphaerae]
MKTGMRVGLKHSIQITVTEEMFAQFEGEVVHPVYSTVSMVYHMEWVSRQILLPYLEQYEEGMGAEVSVKHLAPVTEGNVIRFDAEVIYEKNNYLITNVDALVNDSLIGKGEVVQIVLPKSKINSLIANKNNR